MTERVKVLYIVSGTRSGSTIIDNLLGEVEGFFSAGELRYIWERGLIERRLCGCGSPVPECEVWSQVLELIRRGDGPLPAIDMMRMQRARVRTRHTWRLLRQTPRRLSGDPELLRYLHMADRLYRSVGRVTGSRVVVDSSKMASEAALLRLLPGVDPFYLHLVRDPRAVAHSWRRKKLELDRGEPSDMPTWSTPKTALNWDEVIIAAQAVRRHVADGRWMEIRYEDFVREPRKAVSQIVRHVGESLTRSPFVDEHTALLGGNHTVSGNPSRFRTGRVELSEDTVWVTAQSSTDQRIATLLTLPLLGHYRYPIRLNP